MRYTLSTTLLILVLWCSSCSTAELSAANAWQLFLDHSDDTHLDILVQHLSTEVSRCSWGSQENLNVFPPKYRQQLFDKLILGSVSSLKAGLYIERCLDGGDLEDFFRSAGQFFDRKPQVLLQQMKSFPVPKKIYKSILTMLSLTLVDDLDGQIAAIRDRIHLLEKIQDSKLAELKASGIKALKEQEQSLLSIRNSR